MQRKILTNDNNLLDERASGQTVTTKNAFKFRHFVLEFLMELHFQLFSANGEVSPTIYLS